MYVVAGVTGHTGRAVAETLLAQGEKVRALVRDARRGDPWMQKGAEVAVAQLGDAAAMTKALAGAKGAYFLLPPRFDVDDPILASRPLADALAEAVRRSGVPHVVLLSSFGAEVSAGTGPILSLRHAERTLGVATRNITFLRSAYFFENLAPALPSTQNGALPTFLTPDHRIPMAATADVGRVAAELLLEPATGTRVVEVSTARGWSPNDIAGELSRLLGRPVATQFAPLDGVIPAFTGMGMTRGVAELYRQMIDGLNRGVIARQGPPALRRFGQLGPAEVLGAILEQSPAHA